MRCPTQCAECIATEERERSGVPPEDDDGDTGEDTNVEDSYAR